MLCLDLTILDVWRPLFFFWWTIFSTDFLPLAKKMKTIYRVEVWILWQNAPSNSVLFSSSFICATVSNASWTVKFCENVGKIFTQQTHFYKTWIGSFASVDSSSIFLTINPCRPCWIACANFSKLRLPVVFHTLYLWNEDGDPQFFCISDTSNSLSDCGKIFKKIYRLENVCANVLKMISAQNSSNNGKN